MVDFCFEIKLKEQNKNSVEKLFYIISIFLSLFGSFSICLSLFFFQNYASEAKSIWIFPVLMNNSFYSIFFSTSILFVILVMPFLSSLVMGIYLVENKNDIFLNKYNLFSKADLSSKADLFSFGVYFGLIIVNSFLFFHFYKSNYFTLCLLAAGAIYILIMALTLVKKVSSRNIIKVLLYFFLNSVVLLFNYLFFLKGESVYNPEIFHINNEKNIVISYLLFVFSTFMILVGSYFVRNIRIKSAKDVLFFLSISSLTAIIAVVISSYFFPITNFIMNASGIGSYYVELKFQKKVFAPKTYAAIKGGDNARVYEVVVNGQKDFFVQPTKTYKIQDKRKLCFTNNGVIAKISFSRIRWVREISGLPTFCPRSKTKK